MKRIFTLMLALMIVLALSVTAFAAGPYTITINNSAADHTYEAYQIFAGDLETANGKTVLTNITWGSGVTAQGQAALGDAAAKAESLTTEEDARAFARAVAPYLTNPAESTAGNGTYTIANLDSGYYLVKDKDNTLTNADDFYTAYLMKVVGNVTAAPKGDKPSLDKQIKHNESGEWGVVGDNQIGDTVEFRTITKVPNTAGYTKYDYIIHDTMSAGLTSNVTSSADVTIKVNDTTVLTTEYYIVTATGNSSLPVYHGTEDAVLQIAVGHLEWSSLPVGGESTHCVLSGHRGLPSAKLFTNLDKLVAGDKFIMRVLDEVLTYEVDQILIVEPTDVSTLIIEAGKDLCTLVTCTPYGINSHRLLVRGHRIENQDEAKAIRVTSDAIQIEPLIVAPAVALPMLLVLLVILLVSGGKTKSAGGKKNAKTE